MMSGVRVRPFASVVLLALFSPAVADAQSSDVRDNVETAPEKMSQDSSDEQVQGWDSALSVGANLNLNSNDNVVGQVDGFSALFGLEANGGLFYFSGPHELENTLRINESWARTPTLGEFVKNNDELAIQSLYQYFFLDWSGGFGRASLETNLFTTRQVSAQPETYEVTRNTGRVETREGISALRLSDPFSPMSLQQAGGVFAKPVRTEAFALTARLGLGAHEKLAEGVLVPDDDDSTDAIEVEELENIFQGGAEGFLGVQGAFQNGRIGYNAGVTGFLPVVNNDDENRSAVELFSYDVRAGVNVNIVDGVSAGYSLQLFKDPQFLDKLQVKNSVVLTLAYQLVERREVEPSTEEKLQDARREAQEAEERVDELESQVEGEDGNDDEGASENEGS